MIHTAMMINRRLIHMVPDAKSHIWRKVMVNWLSLVAGIVLWFTVAMVLERVLEHEVEPSELGISFAISILCVATRFILTRRSSFHTHEASACVKTAIRPAIYDKLRRLGGDYAEQFPTAEAVQLAGEGVEQLESYFGNYLPQLFYAMLAPLTLLSVFLPLSPLTAIVLFLCVPLIPAAIAAVQKVARRLLGKYWDAYADLGDSFLENLQGLISLKVYGADQARHETMNADAERFRKATMKVLTMQLNSVTIMDLVAYGGTALGSILCARAFLLGQVSFGGAIAMILLASEFFLAMRALGSYFHVAMNGIAASERMFRLLDLPEPGEGTETLRSGDVSTQNLAFSYTTEKVALFGIDLLVPAGSFTSICGESGCGKTTLAAILSGTRTNYSGTVMIGGIDLHRASSESLRRIVTVVSSKSYLFGGSVRHALLEGKPDATEPEMLDVLRRVNLLEFVESQGGLDMVLLERASNLSGGQRQRLALARALLKDSPIYIFDEATSNIDAESEEDIMQVIHTLKGAHTVILISHRLANVVQSDQILYLSHGKLTEQGTHDGLMKRNGGYASVYRKQMELEHPERKGAALCEETA